MSDRPRRLLARARQAADAVRRWRAAHPRLGMASRIAIAVAVVAAVAGIALVPQFRAASGDLHLLGGVSPLVIAGMLALEGASLISFTLMTRQVLGTSQVRFGRLFAIDLADLAVNHTLPGGGTTAAAARYRLLRAEHVDARTAIGVATIETAVSNLALSLLFGVSATALAARLSGPWYLLAGVLVTVLIGAEALAGWALIARPDASIRFARRLGRRIPLVREERAAGLARQLSETLRALVRSPRRAILCGLAALANWVLDAAVLWFFVGAFGPAPDPVVVLAAYTLGTLISQLPLTPGGLGLVESVTTTALTGLGVGHAAALFGVLGWRVVEYLLPTPVGWAAYLLLRITPRRPRDIGPLPPQSSRATLA